ncbi:helix-turn-helix domain-containing protein [Aliamphritea spongicola]|uniref:helix-turn-helix domain-containing protein n=1 Tax=Aliamphritea spongicola TaxID=707589 RepID=UPI00196AEED2|nr:helix-turn-helix transcriptional regulator [Aliamphritea spongicola]MBN3563178.1 helix-turn-helix transcriptional regulator [Aliamphritea spongicola]
MNLQTLKECVLHNEDVRTEYDALESEFALINQLLEMRKAAGLTQEQVAAVMHTTKSNISRLETGGTAPKIDTIKRYADACGYDLNLTFQARSAN